MDDKTFIASYVAKESQRINERLKAMVQADAQPSDKERDAIVQDIETTLSRMRRALEQIQQEFGADEREKEPQA